MSNTKTKQNPAIPNESNGFQNGHAEILLRSYQHWTGNELITPGYSIEETAQQLFTAPFAVVSHGTEADPIFNYGNMAALELFELPWEAFTQLPSRKSAEPANRETRAMILKQVKQQGYSNKYEGIRISASGRRFQIKGAILWNLLDTDGTHYGQAASFSDWAYLPGQSS